MAPSWALMWSIQTKIVTEEASLYKPKAETIAGLGFRRFSVSHYYISLSFLYPS